MEVWNETSLYTMRIPLVLALVSLVISVLADIYIWNDIRKSTRGRLWSNIYGISSVICWLTLIALECWPKRAEDSGIIWLMWMLYAYLSIYFAKLVYIIFSLLGRLIRIMGRFKTRSHPSRWVGLLAALACLAVMWGGVVYTRRAIDVEEVTIKSPRLPEEFDGYRIVQISDLHVGTWGNDTTFISAFVDSVNALRPDLIVFTGDIVNRKTEEIYPFMNTLARLKAPDGVLSVLGNHDYGDYVDWKDPSERSENNRRLASCQKEMGWDLLNNTRRFIKRGTDSITVVGVENWGDPPFPVYGDLEAALSSSRDSLHHQNDGHFKILLSHNPEHWNRVVSKTTDFDLTLSGHTHAMQMMIDLGGWKWSPAKYRYEQWGGLYERLNDAGQPTRLYVNIGGGEVGMPSRLMAAKPEITLLTLRKTGK